MLKTEGKCFSSKSAELHFLGIFFQYSPIQWGERGFKKKKKLSILESITEFFTERSSCSSFPYRKFFSSLKSCSIQTATHKSCFLLRGTCLLNAILYLSATSLCCQPPICQRHKFYLQDFTTSPKKKRWHFHTTAKGFLVTPLCFDYFAYRIGWILSFG